MCSRARAAPASTTISGVTYAVNTDEIGAGATVNGYDGTAGLDVVILSSVSVDGTDYTVTSIGYAVFSSKQLTSVTLPDSLVEIGTAAFYDNRLTSVVIPERSTDVEAWQRHWGWATPPSSVAASALRECINSSARPMSRRTPGRAST